MQVIGRAKAVGPADGRPSAAASGQLRFASVEVDALSVTPVVPHTLWLNGSGGLAAAVAAPGRSSAVLASQRPLQVLSNLLMELQVWCAQLHGR